MVDLQQDDNTSRLYRLFSMVPVGPVALKKALKESIAERGRRVNEADIIEGDVEEVDGDAGDDDPASKGKGKQRARLGNVVSVGKKRLDSALKWVSDALELKDVFDRLLRVSFADDRSIQAAINEVGPLVAFPR